MTDFVRDLLETIVFDNFMNSLDIIYPDQLNLIDENAALGDEHARLHQRMLRHETAKPGDDVCFLCDCTLALDCIIANQIGAYAFSTHSAPAIRGAAGIAPFVAFICRDCAAGHATIYDRFGEAMGIPRSPSPSPSVSPVGLPEINLRLNLKVTDRKPGKSLLTR